MYFVTLSKQKLKTFASIRKPISITVKSKEKLITADIDLVVIEIGNLFQYELTTVPLSLSKLDGSLNKSPKVYYLLSLRK